MLDGRDLLLNISWPPPSTRSRLAESGRRRRRRGGWKFTAPNFGLAPVTAHCMPSIFIFSTNTNLKQILEIFAIELFAFQQLRLWVPISTKFALLILKTDLTIVGTNPSVRHSVRDTFSLSQRDWNKLSKAWKIREPIKLCNKQVLAQFRRKPHFQKTLFWKEHLRPFLYYFPKSGR